MRISETVKHLIILNIILFVAGFFVEALQQLFAMFFFQSSAFYPWQPLTHMFMHGGFMHIFFNMFALYSFGTTLENIWGAKRFLIFYIACGLGAALMHQGVNYYSIMSVYNKVEHLGVDKEYFYQIITAEGGSYSYPSAWLEFISAQELTNAVVAYNIPVVGASGAIYGLLVAFAFMFPRAELMMMFVPIPIKAMYFVPGILLIDLYGGMTGGFSLFGGGSGIAHFAHIGGAITGFLLMYYWKKTQFNPYRWN
ncbi:rhomboid family intramembrane serine protease [Myroides sp. LJL115]